MTLAELIAANASTEANANDFVAVASRLNLQNILVRDRTVYTSDDLAEKIGTAKYKTFADGMAASTDRLVKDMYIMLVSRGWDFSTNQVQNLVDAVAVSAGLSNALKKEIKEVGRKNVSLAEQEIGAATTDVACSVAWLKYTLINHIGNKSSNATNQVNSGSITTLAALKAYLGA